MLCPDPSYCMPLRLDSSLPLPIAHHPTCFSLACSLDCWVWPSHGHPTASVCQATDPLHIEPTRARDCVLWHYPTMSSQ